MKKTIFVVLCLSLLLVYLRLTYLEKRSADLESRLELVISHIDFVDRAVLTNLALLKNQEHTIGLMLQTDGVLLRSVKKLHDERAYTLRLETRPVEVTHAE